MNQTEYFLFNSSFNREKGLTSIVGARFTIRTVQVQLELQSFTTQPIELHYKARRSTLTSDRTAR